MFGKPNYGPVNAGPGVDFLQGLRPCTPFWVIDYLSVNEKLPMTVGSALSKVNRQNGIAVYNAFLKGQLTFQKSIIYCLSTDNISLYLGKKHN